MLPNMLFKESGISCGKLLSEPKSENLAENTFSRLGCDYTNLSHKFRAQSQDFTRQFFNIYAARLLKMREIIIPKIFEKWGNIQVLRLFELQEHEQEKCVIMGTLFKQQELKPSILKEISEDYQLIPPPPRNNYVSADDKLFLEDDLQRIQLVELDIHLVVTGVVCAILGQDDGQGKFVVDDLMWAGVYDEIPKVLNPSTNKCIVFVSGLNLVNGYSLPLQLFMDWVAGFIGETGDQEELSRIVRVIVAGNSLRNSKEGADNIIGGVKELDKVLVQLVNSVDLDVMSGEFDPTNHMLPQQPLHYCMHPLSAPFRTMHGVTNPYECVVGGRRLLGTSGQPIDDVARYSKLEDPMQILQQTLQWRHLAPTCPDTLSCHPYYKEDPFIIDKCPDVYFAGNQPQFQTSIYKTTSGLGVRLVCIPDFSKTQTCVVVNLDSLHCYSVNFSVDSECEP